jgi:cell wall-associated NlpC family hydrolase
VRRSADGLPGTRRFSVSRTWRAATLVTGATTALALLLPAASGDAAPSPTLSTLVAQAKQLTYQINSLSEQYDGLRVQLSSAKTAAAKAQKAADDDSAALINGKAAVARLAAASYESAGYDPTLQILSTNDSSQYLNQASIMQQLDNENGNRVTQLVKAEAADKRAKATAQQQITRVTALETSMNAKTKQIQADLNKVNSATMTQAMTVFDQTGNYPDIVIPGGSSVGAKALRAALGRRGDPYVWGAAGPSEFDCSGLVMWAYEQEGISLDHYTGDQWDEGTHISRDQLEPGDLVFFYADISHVGLYLGNGLMVDAPATGQDVMVQKIDWSIYVGAVRVS